MCVLFAEGDSPAPGEGGNREQSEKWPGSPTMLQWSTNTLPASEVASCSVFVAQQIDVSSGTVQTLTEKHCSVLCLHIYAEALVSIALLTFQEKQLSTLSKVAKTQPQESVL